MKLSITKDSGFTIVELLIVIVVIAILAAITIVAYAGITKSAQESAFKSTLHQAQKELELAKAKTGSYPSDATLLTKRAGIDFQYTTSNDKFCVAVVDTSQNAAILHTNNTGATSDGPCTIGEWLFDGDAKDSSLLGADGVVTGAVLTTDRKGKANSAYQFNGSSQIVVPNTIQQPNVSQVWSVSAWVKLPEQSDYTDYLVDGLNIGVALSHGTTKRPLLYLNNGTTHDYYSYGNKSIRNNVWTHVVYLFRNSDGLRKIYVNGVDDTYGGPNLSSTPAGIGSVLTIGAGTSGVIDDVRIYDRLLTESEIKLLSSK